MTYRMLPGRRRGLLHGASLWIAPDHILSVKSMRFREEYKRFYLRDIQAIVVADTPRFAVSTRTLLIAFLWLVVFLAARNREPWMPAVLWCAALLLAGSWLYVSYARSCACRIYTAVSRDDLPSIYRRWTARKFLAEVQPLVQQVQGAVEGNWAEAVEQVTIGPRPAVPASSPSSPAADVTAGYTPQLPPPSTARSHSLVSDVFIFNLLAGGALDVATLHSLTRTVETLWYAIGIVQVAAAIGIFIQHHRGILRSGMQKLAIAALILMGGFYYVRQVVATVAARPQAIIIDPRALSSLPGYLLIREIEAGVSLALGLAGLVLIIRASQEPAA